MSDDAPKVSYPGAPVETSTTAFIGRALHGPVNKPVEINDYGDYQRIFGGLWNEAMVVYRRCFAANIALFAVLRA